MNKSIANFIFNFGNRIEGPTFVKDYEDSNGVIKELESIAKSVKDKDVKDGIKMDIIFIKEGDRGEKNVCFSKTNTNNLVNKEKFKSKIIDKTTLKESLVKYRLDKSREERIKPYYIFNNNQLDYLLEKMPSSLEELKQCKGFGKVKVDRYGEDILRILKE